MGKKINIAFCIPDMKISGVETILINTVEELLKNPNLKIKIITHTKILDSLYVEWLKNHPDLSVYIYYPLCNFFEQKLSKYLYKPLYKILFSLYKKYRRVFVYITSKLKNIDVFIDYKNVSFFKEFKYINKLKLVWIHWSLPYFENTGCLSRLPTYDLIIGISNEFFNDFKNKYPKYKNKTFFVYNPIDISNIQKKSKIYNSPTGKYFCHTSRLTKGKDIKTLLNAFDLFAKKYKDVHLYIIGDGDEFNSLKKYTQILNSKKQIIFMGSLDNPYPIMKKAIANILSSEAEGLPTVVLESISLNVPCISTNCKSGPKEILLNGKAGLLFKIGDVNKLHEHMIAIYEKKIDVKAMIDNMKKSIKRFDSKIVCKQIIDIIYNSMKGV